METGRRNRTATVAVIGSIIVTLILILGTGWMGQEARRDTENAAREVSLMYLDELAGRREEVVENNLHGRIETIRIAIDLMTEEDLSDKAHLEAYQRHMKALYELDKFAFVDTEGLIYTSTGTQDNIAEYRFDYRTLSEPEISIFNLNEPDKKVVIAVPVNIPFEGRTLSVCFMEIDMKNMLAGASIDPGSEGTTFCNIYTHDGIALTNTVLGGLSAEDNLIEAMKNAEFEKGYTYDHFIQDFASGNRGVVSFVYRGIPETLSYVPVGDTDWMLTYLIRENVISERIGSISSGIIIRSVIQSILTVAVLAGMFGTIISMIRRNGRLLLEKETADAENRVKQEEMQHRLMLQEKLLEEQKQRDEQSRLIAALSADYWSVYYLELDRDEGVCYQARDDLNGTGYRVGDRFNYLDSVTTYGEYWVTEKYREEFLRFVQPESIREGLRENPVISLTYMVKRHGRESYETLRFARVEDQEGGDATINRVGSGFVDADTETRKTMEQNQTLSDALAAAEQANRAKTVFLSNMSHEIRTPMNAIIGLDNIALNDPETPERTRTYLMKIGDSAEHLLSLINDILDMSRIESGRMTLRSEEFSFPKLLEAINTLFSSQCGEKGLDYRCSILGNVDDWYIGDSMKLRQVLINILSNAVKFTPNGGSVSLTVEPVAQFDRQTTLRFTVSDTGIGMSKEFLPHLFETFTQEDSSSTSKYGSTGLGMSITKSIVEMMNGNIEVESEKGKGTTFTVTVTLHDSDRKDSLEEEILPDELSVLIVDDDPVACEHARLVLDKAGISAETALSGAEAIEMVKLRHARREPYNLILMDWKMPEMDGVETTRRIREEIGQESAIIILTAYSWDEILEEAAKAGVDSFLPKPLFANAVIEEFRAARKRRDSSAQERRTVVDLSRCRILLAEDMPVNAEIMLMLLQMREIQAEHAVNGKEAVEMFAGHEAGYYDAILMDMRMPEMDGLEATRTIRAMERADAKTIPIIALTANAFDEDVQRSLQAGLNAHLSKPIQPEVLFETLESLIGEK